MDFRLVAAELFSIIHLPGRTLCSGAVMKAVLYQSFRQRPQICDVPDPLPPSHGVVVQVKATGLCRSDWHGWMGHDPDIHLPHVPGHELAGEIAAKGARVLG